MKDFRVQRVNEAYSIILPSDQLKLPVVSTENNREVRPARGIELECENPRRGKNSRAAEGNAADKGLRDRAGCNAAQRTTSFGQRLSSVAPRRTELPVSRSWLPDRTTADFNDPLANNRPLRLATFSPTRETLSCQR